MNSIDYKIALELDNISRFEKNIDSLNERLNTWRTIECIENDDQRIEAAIKRAIEDGFYTPRESGCADLKSESNLKVKLLPGDYSKHAALIIVRDIINRAVRHYNGDVKYYQNRIHESYRNIEALERRAERGVATARRAKKEF